MAISPNKRSMLSQRRKTYSENQMQMAIIAVQNGTMNPTRASQVFVRQQVPRTCIPKKYKKVDDQLLEKAVTVYMNGTMTLFAASRHFNIPEHTIYYQSVLWRGYGYKNYSEDSLNQAVQACLEEKMTFHLKQKRFYRKGYKNYSEHDLDLAALAYIKKEMNLDAAVEFYKVPRVFLTENLQKKDRKRHFYKPENLERAVQAVKAGILNTYQAARYFNVPRGTISNKIYARKTTPK
ncbi:unnamed protein product [Mytilus coruscus]|uniref:HTH psq-type domain-containing protein n=1 Tax=Mytilus coruscus TaxID=42192 RepID=A0A6J8AXF8_MYTCO|nr:unnamed protein product [Mytilus coruscus]